MDGPSELMSVFTIFGSYVMLNKVITVLLAIVVCGFVSSVQADMLYDFNGLSNAALNGNGGWAYETSAYAADTAVVADGAVAGWLGTGKYARAGSAQGYVPYYILNYNLTALVDNKDFDISVLSFYDDGGRSQFGALGLMSDTLSADDYLLMGVCGSSTADQLGWYIGNNWKGGSGAGWLYQGLDFGGESKTLRVGCHFTAEGGGVYEMQPYYINVTDAPSTAVNVGSPFTTVSIADIGGVWTKLRIGLNGTGDATGMIDDIRVTQVVPEPSTLALLAAGLIGLLAYAWRKRK